MSTTVKAEPRKLPGDIAGKWSRLKTGLQAAFRKLAREEDRADKDAIKRIHILREDVETITHDVTKFIPQIQDILDGLIRDPDELLSHDPSAYEKIFDDDQIACSIDNAFLPVTEAKFTLAAKGEASRKLVDAIRDNALDVPGWKDLILDLCYAEVTTLRIIRKIWKNATDDPRDPRWVIDKFALKDKRRFRPADTEWRNMFLVDGGTAPLGIAGQWGLMTARKPLDRSHYIIHAWRDTEDRLGWGKGVGPRLYRQRMYRVPLIHILMQFVENNAGGIRYVETMLEGLVNKSVDEQQAWMSLVESQVKNAISSDTVVLPPGASVKAFFPPNGAGDVVQGVVDGYVDGQVSKIMLGATLTEDQSRVGSYALGKEHSKTVHHRMQVRGERIAETLQRDYVEHYLKLNPWVFDEARVPRNTAAPRLVARVPGGESLAEKVQVLNQIKVPIFKSHYAQELGFDEATDQDVDAGTAFVPALVEATIAARGMDVPGLDEYGAEDHPILGAAQQPFGQGGVGGATAGGAGAQQAATPPQVDATGKQVVDGVPVAAAGVEAPTIQEASLMAERMGKIGDRPMYELARAQLARLMGQPPPLPLSDEEWEKIGGGGGPPPGAAPPFGGGDGKPPQEPPDLKGNRAAPWWEAPGAHRADWKEEDHPRDADGKFGSGAGAKGGSKGAGKASKALKPIDDSPTLDRMLDIEETFKQSGAVALDELDAVTEERIEKAETEAEKVMAQLDGLLVRGGLQYMNDGTTWLKHDMPDKINVKDAATEAMLSSDLSAADLRKVAKARHVKLPAGTKSREAIAGEIARDMSFWVRSRSKNYGAHRAEWKEEDHPRAEDGKFGSGGGGAAATADPGKAKGGDKPAKKPTKREEKQAREQRYKDNPIDTKAPPSEVKVVKTMTQDKARKALQKLGYTKEEASACAMAIDRYTYIFDGVIREAQRDREGVAKQHGEGIAREAEYHAQNLEAMMRRNPAERQTLYRGFRDMRSHMFDKLEAGDVFQLDSAMSSTSSDRGAAEGFAIGTESVMIEIRGGVPHSFDVGSMGNFDVEAEVLVASKTRLSIVEMNRRTGHIVCEYTTEPETKKGVLRAKR